MIFAALAMIMFVLSFGLLLLFTDAATNDPSDAQIYAIFAIIGIGTPSIWSAMNLLLLRWRRQTGGQYVAGVRLAREDGAPLSTRDTAAWWFCLNPLLFSWPMAAVALFPLAGVVSITLDRATIAVFGGLLLLCFAAPFAALAAALLDPYNRALHDRVVGTVVVPAE